jgi:hypothetical protein
MQADGWTDMTKRIVLQLLNAPKNVCLILNICLFKVKLRLCIFDQQMAQVVHMVICISCFCVLSFLLFLVLMLLSYTSYSVTGFISFF